MTCLQEPPTFGKPYIASGTWKFVYTSWLELKNIYCVSVQFETLELGKLCIACGLSAGADDIWKTVFCLSPDTWNWSFIMYCLSVLFEPLEFGKLRIACGLTVVTTEVWKCSFWFGLRYLDYYIPHVTWKLIYRLSLTRDLSGVI